MKGCYLLVIENHTPQDIIVGALGETRFKAGYYIYVGSAMGGLEQRIARHRRSEKKLRWHIDYLLAAANLIDVRMIFTDRNIECGLAEQLALRLDIISGFGCSDCRCGSHLFYHRDSVKAEAAISESIDYVEYTLL